MLGSNMSAPQGFAGSDATSTALSFATGSAVRPPSLHVKQRRLFSDSVRRRRHPTHHFHFFYVKYYNVFLFRALLPSYLSYFKPYILNNLMISSFF